jgi:phosphatidylglycerophosphate synthase
MPANAAHTRINDGLLAAAEKRALVRIARRLPRWVTSDQLTVLALLAMVMAGASFWMSGQWPPAVWGVVLALAVNWFGDSLDGTLARVRGHERPRFGYYVDHVLDIVGTSCLLGGLALSGYMTPAVALTVLAAYLLVSAEVFLATAVHGRFRMSFAGFGPTELRIVLAIGALALLHSPVVRPFGFGPFLLFDVGGIVATAGLVVALVTSVARTTTELYRAEPLPTARAGVALAGMPHDPARRPVV